MSCDWGQPGGSRPNPLWRRGMSTTLPGAGLTT